MADALPGGTTVTAEGRHAAESRQPILEVRNLHAHVRVNDEVVRAVDGIDFEVHGGERLAIVGESGSGKSFTALAISKLLPENGSLVAGQILYNGVDLATVPPKEMVRYRGREIAMIFQDPMASLDPLVTIGRQVAESMIIHRLHTRSEAKQRTLELLREVGLTKTERVAGAYPFELSGGMLQRAAIAVALACDPRLLLADEPTTALDPTLQVQVLDLLESLCADRGLAVVLITHDMGVVRRFAERVVVMYAGRVAEQGRVEDVLDRSRHPYTRGLIAAIPGRAPRALLPTIPGSLPQITSDIPGCRFEPRCSLGRGREDCLSLRPLPTEVGTSGHETACHHSTEIELGTG